MNVQRLRLEDLREQTRTYFEEHGYAILPEPLDWLAAVPDSPKGTAPGMECIPSEVWSSAPLVLKLELYRVMVVRITGIQQQTGLAWLLVALCGIQKEAGVTDWAHYRWVGRCATLQKNFLRMIIRMATLYSKAERSEALRVVGFRRRRSTA